MDSALQNKKGLKVYILLAKTPAGEQEKLNSFARQLGEDTFPALSEQTGISWEYHIGNVTHLDNTDTRRADDFLRDAFLRMVQTSCDVVLVVTDAALVSESWFVVPGLAAPEAQVAVISTEKLLTVPLGEPVRSLDSPEVRWNATALLLHLTGHLLKLDHRQEGIMAPFEFEKDRRQLPDFSEEDKVDLKREAKKLAVQELQSKGRWSSLKIHCRSLLERPGEVFSIVWRSRAPLMPFSLTKITTAALTPAF